ncbi:MAG: polysaccharide biosynthesis C-terminal domain-containing protein [Oscillospiraceae bacterium]|nr:polysaccharide biosynthesis C-terminal domain-containing protein [Oscillospiraceae bacterium]
MSKRDFFIPKMYYKLLIPSFFSSLGFAFADMADALVVGNTMGESGLAAISLCLPLFMLINLFMDGLGIGGSIYFSQKLGEGKSDSAVSCFNRITRATLICGILIAILINAFAPLVLRLLGTTQSDGELYYACKSYMRIIALGAPLLMLNIVFSNFLRNDNNAELAARGFLIGNAVDISLNIILVIIFDMGTKGAALSTVIGSFVAICCYLPGIVSKKSNILKLKYVKPQLRETFYCFRTGFSTSVQNLFQLIFLLVINRTLMSLGGEDSVAIFDMMYSASFFIIYLYNGASEAAQPLISTFTGEQNESDCQNVLGLLKRYGLASGAAAAALIFIFARAISSIFGISGDVMPLAVYALRVYCVGFAFVGLNIMYEQYYQARENTGLTFFLVLMKSFAILIPSVLVLSRFGIKAVWLAFPLTEFITFILFLIYRRYGIKRETVFDPERILRVTIENDQRDLGELMTRSAEFCEKWNASAQQNFYVTLIVEEICASIIRNAMKNTSDGKIRVTLRSLENGDFMLHILDNAVVFNPFAFKAGKADINKEFDIDEVSMMMIKNKTKEFMHRRSQGFNSLVIRI